MKKTNHGKLKLLSRIHYLYIFIQYCFSFVSPGIYRVMPILLVLILRTDDHTLRGQPDSDSTDMHTPNGALWYRQLGFYIGELEATPLNTNNGNRHIFF